MRARILASSLLLLCSSSAIASHLVTGNGFGFAVVAPESGAVTKFYPHPYSFERADPAKPLSEGIATPNFIKSLKPLKSDGETRVEYRDDSQIVRLQERGYDSDVWMPFGLGRAVLIVVNEEDTAGWDVEWAATVASRRPVRGKVGSAQVLGFEGIEEKLVLFPLGRTVKPDGGGSSELGANTAWALIAIKDERDAEAAVINVLQWRNGLDAKALAQREIAELEQWRAKPAVHFASEAERHLWRQSEVMLRMAQCRETNHEGWYGNGLIVASLPDGVWFTPWVRDMSFAAVALARMGHRDEARAALLAYFNARPTGKMRAETAGADYQVSVVRYFGDGAEEPFFTEEGSTNIEFDDWGEVLWVLGEYVKATGDAAVLKEPTYRGTVYASGRDWIAKPLWANTEAFGDGRIVAADTSIWEERQKDKKHFAYSTAMAIVGLKELAGVAEKAGDAAAKADLLKKTAELEKGFRAAFVRDGKLHGTLEEGEKNDIDGALLAVIHNGVVTDPALVQSTVDRMDLLKVVSGGYRRVRSTYIDPAIFEYWYERQEFLFVDLSLAEVDWALGRNAEAEVLLQRMVEKAAADHNIIPEMYVALPCKLFPGKIGDPTGALPMVGYGAGAYVLHLLEREALAKVH